MKTSPKDLFIALLAFTTLGAGSLAWHQHSKLLELQSTASLASSERAEWEQRVREAEQNHPAFDSNFIAGGMTSEAVPPQGAPSPDNTTVRPGGQRGGDGPGRGQRNEQLAALMQTPEYIRARSIQQKAALDNRYADLFRTLNADPATIERLKDLLVDRQNAQADVMAAAQEQGLNARENRDGIRDLVQQTQAEIDEAIKATLGDAGFEQYKFHEQTQPQRNLVGQLENKLSYSGSPLQPTQADQLVRILAETSSQAATGGLRGGGGGGFGGRGGNLAGAAFGGGGISITDEVIAKAQTVLAQPQLSALQQLQTEQQVQREMQQTLRSVTGGNRGGRGGPQTGGTSDAPANR